MTWIYLKTNGDNDTLVEPICIVRKGNVISSEKLMSRFYLRHMWPLFDHWGIYRVDQEIWLVDWHTAIVDPDAYMYSRYKVFPDVDTAITAALLLGDG